MPPPIEQVGRWTGLEEYGNRLADGLARNLWVKHKPLRKIVGFLWRMGHTHKLWALGGCALLASGWLRGAAREAVMERLEARLPLP